MTDIGAEKTGHGDDRAFLAWLVAAVILSIGTLGFYMWDRANSGGNEAPFLAAVQHR